MKSIIKSSIALRGIMAIAVASALCSFALLPGSDSFQVYLNDKLILEQYLHGRKDIATVSLDPTSEAQLSVNYSHCGALGTARVLRLKDKEKLLKEWKFADADIKSNDPMIFKVKDLASAAKGHNNLQLTYMAKGSAKEFVLTRIELSDVSAHK